MSTYPPPRPGGIGRNFEEVIDRIEMELRQAVTYVNDAVVPQVRRESIAAMRSAAEMLRNLADRFEAARPVANPPSNPAPGYREPDRQEPRRQDPDPKEPDRREPEPLDPDPSEPDPEQPQPRKMDPRV